MMGVRAEVEVDIVAVVPEVSQLVAEAAPC